MSQASRLKRSKDNAASLAVSIGLHTLALLCLFWIVTAKQPLYQNLSLSVSVDPSAEEFAPLAVFPSVELTPEAEPEQLVEVDLASTPISQTAISSDSLLEQLIRRETAVDFFGSRAYGNRFVYILDISVSMSARRSDRFLRAKEELLRSISSLSPQQSYYILSFCWRTSTMYQFTPSYGNRRDASGHDSLQYVQATDANLDRLRQWLYKVRLGSGTDPRRALSLAHSLKPDAVFFLSDGDFNQSGVKTPHEGWLKQHNIPSNATVLEGVQKALADVPIHTIAYENPFTRAAMKQIADATGGTSRYVKTRSLRPMVDSTLINGLRAVHAERRRAPDETELHHAARLQYAKTLIEDGELAYAEFLVRPTREYEFQSVESRQLRDEIFDILEVELGDVKVEDFHDVSLVDIHRKTRTRKNFQRFPGYF